MTAEDPQLPTTPKTVSIRPLYLLFACVVVTVGTFSITYPVSVYVCKYKETCLGDQNEYFLSNSINYPYASNMGAFGLTFGAVLLFIVMVTQYLIMSDKTVISEVDNKEHINKLNFAGLVNGILSAAGAIGVLSFQIHNIATAHYISAAFFFGCGFISLAIFGWAEFLLDGRTFLGICSKIRVVTVIISFLMGAGWVIAYAALDSTTTDYAIVAATFEVVMFICFEVILLTWVPGFSIKTMMIAAPLRDQSSVENKEPEQWAATKTIQPTESTPLM